ncbi:MAG: ABC transporter ATP-binding protein [Prolixibacteraceae bacterium]|nr:ABC transporter ATP-binding protein [Prolixibacteraceae bacterium]MBN2775986.1 ABC transporter ATP-binding protein [Prolixibacteraceae bacterium]
MLLQLEKISKGYGNPESHSFRPVLNELSLEVREGKKVAIVGPSGSGKTTLLNIAGALDRPDSGKVIFKGKNMSGITDAEMAEFRNKELGFVFQMHYLLPQLTLWENVMLPVLPFKKKIHEIDRSWAEHLLKRVGIWDRRFQRPSELSGGECQRTAVVRALVNKPQLLLADEPTGALDEQNAATLGDLLISLSKEENVAMVVVTHSQDLAARMDNSYYLRNGILN